MFFTVSYKFKSPIKPFLGPMKASIKDMEQEKTVTEASLMATARKFNATWKDEIDVLNRDCIQSFSNFKCGTRIIQGSFLSIFSLGN